MECTVRKVRYTVRDQSYAKGYFCTFLLGTKKDHLSVHKSFKGTVAPDFLVSCLSCMNRLELEQAPLCAGI